jgi:hypothetical protein
MPFDPVENRVQVYRIAGDAFANALVLQRVEDISAQYFAVYGPMPQQTTDELPLAKGSSDERLHNFYFNDESRKGCCEVWSRNAGDVGI